MGRQTVITAALAAGAAFGAAAWAVRGRSSQVFAPSVWRGRGDAIALTFDDGPSEGTPRILDVLARHGVKATFFVCGHNVERLPEILLRVHRDGHEIGNHTWSHPRLDFHSVESMRAEIGRTQRIVEKLTGRPPALFRAPYGVRWPGLGAVQREFGLTGVMWTRIGKDWKLESGAIARRLLRGAAGGDILCLHDGRELAVAPDVERTAAAAGAVLTELLGRGFVFRPVSGILER